MRQDDSGVNISNPGAVTVAMIACLLVLSASYTDWRHRLIPNPITLGGAGCGIIIYTVSGGGDGLLFALGGWAVGFACFSSFFGNRVQKIIFHTPIFLIF